MNVYAKVIATDYFITTFTSIVDSKPDMSPRGRVVKAKPGAVDEADTLDECLEDVKE